MKSKPLIIVMLAAIATLLIIAGCSKQDKPPEKSQPAQAISPPEAQQNQPPAQVQQPITEDDIYKDNLNESLDELSQVE